MATAAAPAPPVPTGPDFFQKFLDLLELYPGSGLRELIRLVPDSLFLGVGLFAFLAQNYAMGMLFMALFEAMFITVGIQNLMGYISLSDTIGTEKSGSKECIGGFQSPTLQTVSIFFNVPARSSFPSSPIFILTTALMYVVSSAQGFSAELSELGPAFSTRYYIGLMLSLILLFIVATYRFMSGCDGFGTISLSLLFGAAAGIVLCWQNTLLFGRESTNIIGVPMFANRTADGKPIYICPTAS
jgi:hypothetical protein